jgi:hypothetical protein
MANEQFVKMRKTKDQRLGHLVEEFGEVLAAIGKIMSFGWYSVNPLLPPEEQEANIDWFLRELDDAELAIRRLREKIAEEASVFAAAETDFATSDFYEDLATVERAHDSGGAV